MAIPLGTCFSIVENRVPQCDIGSTAQTLVIHFDQERFEQLLFGSNTSPLHVRKQRKVSIARAPLATPKKQVSIETTEVLCEPKTASRQAKLAPCARKQASLEVKQAPCEPK